MKEPKFKKGDIVKTISYEKMKEIVLLDEALDQVQYGLVTVTGLSIPKQMYNMLGKKLRIDTIETDEETGTVWRYLGRRIDKDKDHDGWWFEDWMFISNAEKRYNKLRGLYQK